MQLLHPMCLTFQHPHKQPMNRKLSLLIPGMLALTVSALPVLPVAAESAGPMLQAQAQRQKLNLNLTEAQKAELKQIRQSTQAQIQAVFTSEQKAQIEAAKQQGQKPRQYMSSLNLTAEQKARIREIRQESKKKMDAVLTAEQRQQLQERRQQMKQRRQAQPRT